LTGYLLDTHIWLWYLEGSDRLPAGLRRTIGRSECWLSPVSVWELGLLARRGRVRAAATYRQFVRDALRSFPVREAGLNIEIALQSMEIDPGLQDPADRFLAATAMVFDLTLLTVDTRLTQLRQVTTKSR
jgi:PIN domain nuclease of toxin-antitoxin system